MEHPSHPRRLALATVVIGATLGLVAPQWVAATPGSPTPAADVSTSEAPARAVSADTATGRIATLPTSDVAVPVALPPVAEAAGTEAPATQSPVAAPAVQVPVASAPPAVPVAPATPPASPAAPVAAADEGADDVSDTGSITVHVSTRDGATRSVSLQTSGWEPVGDRTTVTGAPVTFDDLEPGTYELFVEQVADEGGSMLTRTVLTVTAGEDVVVTCDADSLDCTR